MQLHHPLGLEFADHRETIQRLKEENAEFRQLADEYHAIDRRVCLIERAFQSATEAEIESLKKRRLWLKDALYHEIRKAAQLV
jgi:uncharacterized protein